MAILVLLAVPGRALTPYQVKQINANFVPGSSSPQDFWPLETYAVFTADDGVHGPQPWRSDGTLGGTHRLSRCPDCLGAPAVFGELGDMFFFFAEATGSPGETALWVTRGTAPSTRQLLAPVVDQPECSDYISWDFAPQGLIYFPMQTATGGCQLWRSDGTEAGTFELADFSAPEATFPEGLTYYAGAVFYGANDGTGAALWKTDGTRQGTRLVVRIAANPDDDDPGPSLLNVAGSELVFAMDTTERGYELWHSNGTAAGTQPLPELVHGPASPYFYDFLPLGPRLLFVADNGHGQNLWSTTGTGAARQLTHFESSAAFGQYFGFLPRILLDGKAFFSADDGTHGAELWTSDGTPEGTHMVSDVCPGSCSSNPYPQAVLGSSLLFSADDGVHGSELWATDGTAAGTHMVDDLCAGSCAGAPQVVAVIGSRALMLANGSATDTELWATNGSAAGTRQLTFFGAAETPWPGEVNIQGALPDVLLFAGYDAVHGDELWVSDGTRAGTHLLDDIDQQRISDDPNLNDLTAAGDRVFFFATNGNDGELLWVSDGTAGGTVEASDAAQGLAPGGYPPTSLLGAAAGSTFFFNGPDAVWRSDGSPAGTFPLTPAGVLAQSNIAAVGGTAFFASNDGEEPALWKSDGTPGGTAPVGGPPWTSGAAQALTPWNGQLYYFVDSGSGEQLWRSDGTAAGTVQVASVNAEFDSNATLMLAPFGSRLFFFAQSGEDQGPSAFRLWSTDGTAAGTQESFGFGLPPGQGVTPLALAAAGNQLFIFTASGLWVGDGTESGTVLVSTPAQIGVNFSPTPPFAALGNRLAFLGGNTVSPAMPGLWVSDGTAAGTMPLTDGQSNYIVADQVATVAGQLAISALQGVLWQSDGTPAGTTQLVTGLEGIPFQELTVAGGRVFFERFDAATGNQLWAAQP